MFATFSMFMSHNFPPASLNNDTFSPDIMQAVRILSLVLLVVQQPSNLILELGRALFALVFANDCEYSLPFLLPPLCDDKLQSGVQPGGEEEAAR